MAIFGIEANEGVAALRLAIEGDQHFGLNEREPALPMNERAWRTPRIQHSSDSETDDAVSDQENVSDTGTDDGVDPLPAPQTRHSHCCICMKNSVVARPAATCWRSGSGSLFLAVDPWFDSHWRIPAILVLHAHMQTLGVQNTPFV